MIESTSSPSNPSPSQVRPAADVAALAVVSLFSGAGGLDIGFRQEGFGAVLALDESQAAVDSYNENDPAKAAVRQDLKRLGDAEFLRLIDERAPGRPIRGLIGGPPCQSFSIGNVRKHRHDRRGALGYHYARLLNILNFQLDLDFFVFENVTGIRDRRHRRKYRRILSALDQAGFNISAAEMNASAFGVPQRRHRLVLVGINRRKFPWIKFEFPLGHPEIVRTVRDAITGLPRPKFFERGLAADKIPHHPNHWTMQPKSSKFRSPGTRAADGRSFRSLDWDQPSRTVAYGHREIHLHPEGDRRLSVLEAMLLQGFPTTYVLRGTLSDQISQVSNAVPPPLAAAVARAIKAQLYEPLAALHRRLLGWFKTHQRRFPWRDTLDPFQILVAEKLLQQTSATASVVAAYRELLARYPDCGALARASVKAVRQIIKPLGPHYRAGELVRLAKAIRRRHDGQVPRDLGNLLSLPSVGDYAARAVQAFAFGRAVGVVDTNVARFLCRYFGLSNPKTKNPARNRSLLAIAGALVPASGAREFNLAILDLCAAHCTAIGPSCEECPLAAECAHALKSGTHEPLTRLAKSVRLAGRPTAA